MASYRFQKIGRSIIYVFLLSALASVPLIIQLHTLFRGEFLEIKNTIAEEVPDFIIEDGLLQTDDPTPIIKYSETFTFAFDPNVSELSGSLRNSDSLFALLEDRAIIKVAGQEQLLYFQTLDSTTLSKAETLELLQSLEDLYPIFTVMIIVVTFLVTGFLKFITVTFFAYLATLLAKSSRRSISYKQGWNIIAYTLTIPTVFFFIMDMLEVDIPFSFSLQAFIIFFLLFLIIRDIPPQKTSKH